MNNELKLLISRILSNADDALNEVKNDPNDSYNQGRLLAYWEVLDTIKSELIVSQHNPNEYGLGFDIYKKYIQLS